MTYATGSITHWHPPPLSSPPLPLAHLGRFSRERARVRWGGEEVCAHTAAEAAAAAAMFYNVAEERAKRKRWRDEHGPGDHQAYLSARAASAAGTTNEAVRQRRRSVSIQYGGPRQRASTHLGSWSSLPLRLPDAATAAALSHAGGGNSSGEKENGSVR